MNVDTIFAEKESGTYESFEFDKRVVNVFDDMVNRSVPGYSTIQLLVADMALDFYKGDYIYDIGCSTGNTIDSIIRRAQKPLKIIGIDNSPEMIESCKEKFLHKNNEYSHDIILKTQDILNDPVYNEGPADVIIFNLVLQFIRPLKRRQILKCAYDKLKPGGCIVLVEKTVQPDKFINDYYIKYYHSYKKEMGYSDMEISNKREALENRLIPFLPEENLEMLQSAGFSKTTTFFQWMNFYGFLAVKE